RRRWPTSRPGWGCFETSWPRTSARSWTAARRPRRESARSAGRRARSSVRSLLLGGRRLVLLGRLLGALLRALGLRLGLPTLGFDRGGGHRVHDGHLGPDLQVAGHLGVLGARDLPLLLALLNGHRVV